MRLKKKNVIFDMTRSDWKYKGILFAEADNEEVDRQMLSPFPTPKDYVAGCMAMIYVDEKGIWNWIMRIKFPSGNKQIVSRSYDDTYQDKNKLNVTYLLQDIYALPMVKKMWYPNPTEDSDGMMAILEKSNMIESKRYLDKDENETDTPPQPNDQDNINKAIDLFQELIEVNPQIEGSIWAAALISMTVFGYKRCGFTYEQFRQEMNRAFDFYKEQYNEQE